MDDKLLRDVALRLERKESAPHIRSALIESGYSEQDIDEALRAKVVTRIEDHDKEDKRNSRLLAMREFFDRVGYGAASPQFINILFFLSGASYFFVGLINGLRTVLSLLFTAVLQEYSKVHRVSRNIISAAGLVFGFSFFIMAFAVRAHIAELFAIGMLFAGLGVVTYGDLYSKFVLETLRREKMGAVLRRMAEFGIIITMAAMLLSGWLIDRFPQEMGGSFQLFGMSFHPVGYLISFEITAFAFIISSYILSMLKEQREDRRYPLGKFVREHLSALNESRKELAKNKFVALLLAATAVTGLLEVLGQSFYGIFIYREFEFVAFGGFLNVAIIYGIAIMTSFTGPWFTHRLHRAIGLSPMLVFGTLLSAILPLTLVFNANIVAVGLALACSVIGAAIVGVAQGMLARKLMDEGTRRKYFMSLGLILAIPYLVFVPVGAWFAQWAGLPSLFLAIGISFVVVVAPLYFILVAMSNQQRL